MLDIVPSRNSVQYRGEVMMQTWENSKKTNFGLSFPSAKLDVLPSYHLMQFKGKLLNKTRENGKKSHFEAWFFAHFGPNLNPKMFFHWFYFSKILDIVTNYHCMKFQEKHTQTQANNLISGQFEKPHFGPDLDPLDPSSIHQFFFSKTWLRKSLDVMVKYRDVKYQKKTNDPILKKFSDGQTDRQTKSKSDFVGRCPTDAECSTY